MKKRLKKAGKALLFSALYIIVYVLMQVICQGMLALYLKHTGENRAEQYTRLLNSTYGLTVIAMVLSMWIYIIIFNFRKQYIEDRIRFVRMTPAMKMMMVGAAIGSRFIVSVYFHYAGYVDVLKKSIDTASEFLPQPENNYQMLIMVFVAFIAAPIFEEILFRGLIMEELLVSFKPWFVILLQAVFFGAAHMVLFQSVFAVFVGIFLGIIYYRTRNIRATAICHGVFNFSEIISAVEMNDTVCIVFAVLGVLLLSASMAYIIKFSKT